MPAEIQLDLEKLAAQRKAVLRNLVIAKSLEMVDGKCVTTHIRLKQLPKSVQRKLKHVMACSQ